MLKPTKNFIHNLINGDVTLVDEEKTKAYVSGVIVIENKNGFLKVKIFSDKKIIFE